MGKPGKSSAPSKPASTTNVGGFEFTNGVDGAPGSKPAKPPNKRMLRMGATVTAKQPHVTSDGIVVKEWQRLPRQLLQEYCQAQKLNKPIYARSHISNHHGDHGHDANDTASGNTGGKYRIRCIIPDHKGNKANDINVVSAETFDTVQQAEHMSALLMLHTLTPTLPHDKKLPDPYADAWKSLRTDKPAVTSNSKYVRQSEKEQQHESTRARENLKESAQLERSKQYYTLQMSEMNQKYIENIIKTLQSVEEQHDSNGKDDNSTNQPDELLDEPVTQQMVAAGFDSADVTASIRALRKRSGAVIDADTCLEHLLFNTPESRLPAKYTQQRKSDFTVVSSSVDKLGSVLGVIRQCVPSKVIDLYTKDCNNVYDICTLLYRDVYSATQSKVHTDDTVDNLAVIEEELSVLESIYDTMFNRATTDDTTTQWTIDQPQFSVSFIVSATNSYPHELPVVVLTSTAHELSASQVMYVLQCVGRHLTGQQLIGHAITYDTVQYFNDNWVELLEKSASTAYSIPAKWQKYIRTAVLSEQQVQQLHQSHAVPTDGQTTSKPRTNGHQRGKRVKANLIEQLHSEYLAKQQSKPYQAMVRQRSQLPVYSRRDELLPLIRNNQLVIVDAQTGSGKSTQIPQLILDDCITQKQPVNIICTQPRRISAIGLAGRVSDERCESIGHTVGYRVRLDNKVSDNTCLTYVTVGILLKQLVSNNSADFNGLTHIVIDEIHERSVDIDLVLLLVKQILQHNRTIKLVLMSATLTAGRYHKYFGSVIKGDIPVMSIAGRMFDVAEIYLEDIFSRLQYKLQQRQCIQLNGEALENKLASTKQYYSNKHLSYNDNIVKQVCVYNQDIINYDLIEQLILNLIETEINMFEKASKRQQSGILVFLPGVGEINRLLSTIEAGLQQAAYGSQYTVIALHSQLSNQQQGLVFKNTHTTKIVLSTNIAETSITVNDIAYVIDTGKSKQNMYNSITGISSLTEQFITKSNATQRKGRAGRVQAGTVYRLYSRFMFDSLDTEPVPELKRVNLDHICLQLTQFASSGQMMNRPVADMLADTVDPPSLPAIQHAIHTLTHIGALDADKAMTPLGQHLTALPVNNVKIGKLLLYGCMLQCVTASVCIAAILSANKSILTGHGNSDNATTPLNVPSNKSDYMHQYNWFKLWYNIRYGAGGTSYKARQFAHTNGLNDQTCDMVDQIVTQYTKALMEINFINNDFKLSLLEGNASTIYDLNNNNTPIITGVLCSSLYPNVIKVRLPQAKYQQAAHGSVAVENDAKSIKYFIRQLPEQLLNTPAPVVTAASNNAQSISHHDQRVFIHPRSVNFYTTDYDCPYLLYNSIQSNDSNKITVFDCTVATAYSYLLLSNSTLTIDHQHNLIVADQYIKFKCNNTRVIVLLKQLRRYLDILFQNKIRNPQLPMTGKTNPVLDAIQRIITTNGF